MTEISTRWRELLAARVIEAVEELSQISGLHGLVIGGSIGRAEPWPLSDIDLLPISRGDTRAEVARRQSAMVDWWAASGRAQTLDVGWVCFDVDEVEKAIASGPSFAAERMAEPRWLHGLDKSYGGHGAGDPDGLAQSFADWATAFRFDPEVVAARVREWRRQVGQSRDRATTALRERDADTATLALREAARALRMVLLERWGERLGSMGREWTRFEQMARTHGAEDLAAQLTRVADASAEDAAERTELSPPWLRERIELAWAGRRAIEEDVSAEQNARDQIAAFAVHVSRRRAPPFEAWLGLGAAVPEEKLAELDALIELVG